MAVLRPHRINFSYFDLSRSATNVLTTTITIPGAPGSPFLVTDTVLTTFDWETFVASYTWSFLQTNTYELGFTIGANITTLKFGIASLGLGTGATSKPATVPLPVLGLSGAYAFTPKLILRSDFGWFGLKVGDVDGSQWIFNLDLEYNMWKHVGFGIGYNFYRLDVEVTDSGFNGKAQYDYNGGKVFVKFYL